MTHNNFILSNYSQLKSHEEALKDVKEKLVSSQCDLMDAKDKIDDLTQEKSKLVKVMKIKLEELSKEKKKIVSLENQISNFSASDVTSEEAKNVSFQYFPLTF